MLNGSPILNQQYSLFRNPSPTKDSSQTVSSRKSSDAFSNSPPRAVRHRLKRKRYRRPPGSSKSTTPKLRQSYSPYSSPYIPRYTPVYNPYSPIPLYSPPRRHRIRVPVLTRSPTPISESLTSSSVTPTPENWNEQPPPITVPQMPPLLPPPPPPKQVSSPPPSTSSKHFPFDAPGLTNISSDEDDAEKNDEPPAKRQRNNSSSSSSSSSSAVNHAWDSD